MRAQNGRGRHWRARSAKSPRAPSRYMRASQRPGTNAQLPRSALTPPSWDTRRAKCVPVDVCVSCGGRARGGRCHGAHARRVTRRSSARLRRFVQLQQERRPRGDAQQEPERKPSRRSPGLAVYGFITWELRSAPARHRERVSCDAEAQAVTRPDEGRSRSGAFETMQTDDRRRGRARASAGAVRRAPLDAHVAEPGGVVANVHRADAAKTLRRRRNHMAQRAFCALRATWTRCSGVLRRVPGDDASLSRAQRERRRRASSSA